MLEDDTIFLISIGRYHPTSDETRELARQLHAYILARHTAGATAVLINQPLTIPIGEA